jgi:hypothetical protein
MKGEKAQGGAFGMSFGVLFSIILIIFILVVAGIAITKFLGLKKCAQIGMFIDGLQEDIDKAWNSQKFTDDADYILPGNIDYVCFANLTNGLRGGGEVENKIYSEISIYQHANANMFFYPRKNACDMSYVNVKHINIEKITQSKNPYCFKNDEGVVININKGFNDALVSLS